jgi:hypothetical protein
MEILGIEYFVFTPSHIYEVFSCLSSLFAPKSEESQGYSYDFHFTDENIESQRGKKSSQTPQRQRQRRFGTPNLTDSKAGALPTPLSRTLNRHILKALRSLGEGEIVQPYLPGSVQMCLTTELCSHDTLVAQAHRWRISVPPHVFLGDMQHTIE